MVSVDFLKLVWRSSITIFSDSIKKVSIFRDKYFPVRNIRSAEDLTFSSKPNSLYCLLNQPNTNFDMNHFFKFKKSTKMLLRMQTSFFRSINRKKNFSM